jgi:hypothetical protein
MKSNAIPVTGRGGLQSGEMLRVPHSLENRLAEGGVFVSLTHGCALFLRNTLNSSSDTNFR